MASCYICGSNIDEPKLDFRDMKIKPCSTCEQVIGDILDSYEHDSPYTYSESRLEEFDDEVSGMDR